MKALESTIAAPMAQAELIVRSALGDQGFGVLTEMDVAAVLKAKIGVDRSPLKILGACNPDFANRALTIDPTVTLILPCNVVLETVSNGTRVSIADPRDLMPNVELAELAAEAAQRLVAVISAIEIS